MWAKELYGFADHVPETEESLLVDGR